MPYLPVYVYFICLGFLSSLTVYTRWTANRPAYLKLFPPFLFATLVIETLGSYLSAIKVPNLALYNFFTVFEFCFYLWVISLVITGSRMITITRITAVFYLVIAVVNIIFIQKMKQFHTMSYAFGCLLIVAFCIYYFYELFKFPKAVKLVNNPAFWICSGLLFFYCCSFPMFGLFNFMSQMTPLIVRNFYSIITILNIFLYSLFTIAFLCILKTPKYTLSRS